MGKLICTKCHQEYSLNEPIWKCSCGGLLNIEFNNMFDIKALKYRQPTMWRYKEALPIENKENIVSLSEGFTPLLETTINNKKLYLKMEHLFNSGSYKDRGASVLISKVKELNIERVIEDSSGNAGSAIASYCARAGIKCDILVPEDTSPAKLVQILRYGAILHKIKGDREATANTALSRADKIYYASHSWNPFFFQGIKTFAYEIWEQLDYTTPETIIIPTGNGTLLIGVYTGFKDLLNHKLIKKLPRIIAVQSEGCCPIYQMWHNKLDELPLIKRKHSIAEGISIAKPVRANQIIQILKETNGNVLIVSDREIIEALSEISKKGFYIEPTSASVIAAIKKLYDLTEEIVVAPLTGHGLKSTEKY
jgi:threonine synthase